MRVTDFLKHLPVRREAALRSSAKTQSKIKRMVQAYAITRPSVRFSRKVLKAKNEKGNWIYAPKADATVMDAAMKVFDHQAIGHCLWQVWTSTDGTNEMTSQVDGVERYVVEALLPQRQCGEHNLAWPAKSYTGANLKMKTLQPSVTWANISLLTQGPCHAFEVPSNKLLDSTKLI